MVHAPQDVNTVLVLPRSSGRARLVARANRWRSLEDPLLNRTTSKYHVFVLLCFFKISVIWVHSLSLSNIIKTLLMLVVFPNACKDSDDFTLEHC